MSVIDFPSRKSPEAETLGKLPPQNIEAEQAVLGAILIDNASLNKALEIIHPDYFYREAHRRIFSAVLDLNERNEVVDLITLTDHLRKKNELEMVGGATYLSFLVNSIPTAANIRQHSRIIHEKAILRNLITVATDIVGQGYEDQSRVEELLDFAERSIFGISERKLKPSFVAVKEIIKDSFETIERLYEKKERVTGVATGYRDLDEMTSGLQPSDLIVIAGRPSMGKTALALGVAQHLGIEKRGTAAIFSLEMSKEQLVMRMLCSEARVDAHKLRSGYLGRADWPKLTTAAGRIAEARIFIDDTPAISVLEMRAKARRLKAEHGLDLVIVDYLQLMRGRGEADNREQEISEISRSLKALAKELQLPVVAMSQLSRAVENRSDKRPILADLRESGAIEQDADIVIFIYRDEVYHTTDENKGIADIIVGKQRNGPIGNIKLAFLDRYTRFENLEKVHEEVEEF
ncbi:MAG: replicative DNA helicase [Nitrospirae bacterium]|nr:replicative DNA helicase [Nitrospirota bacterium]